MAVSNRVKIFLDLMGRTYMVKAHPLAYTSQETAALEHIPGRQLAKVVMLRSGERYFMVAVPATNRVDLHRIAETMGVANVQLATEREFRDLFPECEVGAMPPFGNLYGIDVLVDENLARNEEISFKAGSHRETVRMRTTDYLDLVRPRLGCFSR